MELVLLVVVALILWALLHIAHRLTQIYDLLFDEFVMPPRPPRDWT